LKAAWFPTLNDSWPWPWIESYCIPSCITHRPLPTCQISLTSKKRFVDKRTYRRTYICTYTWTFETGFIRQTLSNSRPKNERISNFQGLVTLTFILHTIMLHSSTSTYVPNFIKMEETFCGWTDIQTNIWDTLF